MQRNGQPDEDRGRVRLAPVEETGVEVVRYEERLDVGVKRVPARRVRLVKHVMTERRVVEVRREELRIEEDELPVDARASEASVTLGRGEPLEIVLSEEEVVLTRTVVPRERVRVWVEDVAGERRLDVPVSAEHVAVDLDT
jgi:uncharacterized protein (TIGR02271 family)